MPEITNKEEYNKFEDESQSRMFEGCCYIQHLNNLNFEGVVKNLTLKEFDSFLNDHKKILSSFCNVDPVTSWDSLCSPLSIKVKVLKSAQ